MIESIGALLIAHMVADYPLQADWVAEHKHENLFALSVHAAFHGVFAWVALLAIGHALYDATLFAWVLMTLHAGIDAGEFHIRWDQTAHLLTCVAVGGIIVIA